MHLNTPFIRGGFMPPAPLMAGVQVPSFARSAAPMLPEQIANDMAALERGEFTGEITTLMMQFNQWQANFARSITSTTSNLPIRENLEAEAKILVPMETPVRNRLPRSIGSGTASAWRQITAFGGGYGISTTVTTGASSATQTFGTTVGMYVGQSIFFATSNAYRIVASITNGTVAVMTATISTTTAEVVTAGPFFQPGGDAAAIRSFFAESGAPAPHTETYAAKSATYKLLGTYADITGLAMAAGANFQNQLAMMKTNAIRNLMLNEENALINGDSSSIQAPWGDTSNALAFDGLLNLVTTANGCPAPHIQTSVGALTTTHVDSQLTRIWNRGGQNPYIICNAQEGMSFVHLAEASGSIIRVSDDGNANVILGVAVSSYKHPITGQKVPIQVSRFMPAGTMLFCSEGLPDGTPAADVQVLPQVQLPELAPNDNVQGYVAQELAPTTSAPQVYPTIVTVFEVLRMKAATVWAKSSGLTAV